ncbi:putative porin [Acinetobacter shaoyimingii]|uniref:Putative porin n=1 Tax=Acinetobacter shaoyimingii TaxID=2715164 RepID=A0A6G8RRX6_9GAMM|nr:putative porin [Acinetobacter shaoyimingii]QIO04627.1 putative porin [Acinetobacter shaoyimingii]
MLKKLALFSAIAASISSVHAYQAEIGGSYNHLDYDNSYYNEDAEGTTYQIDGVYYFNPVEVKNSPLNEAAFLNRASNLNAKISHSDHEASWYEWHSNDYSLGIEYFIPNSNFYVNANLGYSKEDDDYSETRYSAEFGYLATPGLLLAVGASGYDGDYGYNELDPTFRIKYVTQAGEYDVNFEAKVTGGEDTSFNVGADVYLDKTLSIGAAYHDGGELPYNINDIDVFTLRAKKFFTPSISLEAKADFGDYIQQYNLRVGYRF